MEYLFEKIEYNNIYVPILIRYKGMYKPLISKIEILSKKLRTNVIYNRKKSESCKYIMHTNDLLRKIKRNP